VNIAEVISQLSDGTWPMLDNPGAGMREDMDRQSREIADEADTLAAPFRTPAGKACLELLLRKTLLRPLVPLPIGSSSAEQVALYAAQRQGQNGVVTMILQALAGGSTPVETEPAADAPLQSAARSKGSKRTKG